MSRILQIAYDRERGLEENRESIFPSGESEGTSEYCGLETRTSTVDRGVGAMVRQKKESAAAWHVFGADGVAVGGDVGSCANGQ